MTTQELKQYIDKVLGNSIRCLLPSYWWKRLFNQVADRIDEVEQTTSQLIDSKVEEVKMPIVESVDELSKLNLPKGGVAAVEKVGEPVIVNYEDCYISLDYVNDWDKYTIIKGVGEIGEVPSDAEGGFIPLIADKYNFYADTLVVGIEDGKRVYGKYLRGGVSIFTLDEINEYLASGRYRLGGGLLDAAAPYFTLYSDVPQPSLYIKGETWEKLSKEYVVSSEEELNALSVEIGTIAKVVSGGRVVGSFNSLAVGDRVDDVEFMQPPYAFGSCSVMFKDKDGNDIGFGVDSNGIECQFGLVTRDVGTIIFGNEKGINQDLYNQAMTIFKEKECTFEWVEGKLPVDSFVRPVTKTPFVSDAYIKADTWTRLLKEGDVTNVDIDTSNLVEKSEIKTLNGVSLLGGGNLQLGDGQTIVYDDTEVKEVAYEAKALANLAIENLEALQEELDENIFEQLSQLLKDMDDLSARVAELERIIQQQ
jgi:hypothetical protein